MSTTRIHLLPSVVMKRFRLPSLSLFPGQIPALKLLWRSPESMLVFTPTSAMIGSASPILIPGIVPSRRSSTDKGRVAFSASNVSTFSSKNSTSCVSIWIKTDDVR